MHYVIKHIKEICEIIAVFYGIATLMGLITPSNDKKTVMSKIGRFFDRVGFNIKGFFKKY
jgi:hypothetical protein